MPTSVCWLAFTLSKTGLIGRLGLRMMRATSKFALMISQASQGKNFNAPNVQSFLNPVNSKDGGSQPKLNQNKLMEMTGQGQP